MEEGLYESLITEGLRVSLTGVPPELVAAVDLSSADAADRLALHLAVEVERLIESLGDSNRVTRGIEIVRDLLERIGEQQARPVEPGSVLRSIAGRRPDGRAEHARAPLTPLLDTALLTNAPGEPALWAQLRSEIASADRIDLIMAFVRRSGIRPLLDDLAQHCRQGRQLRVLTTTYTGSTERAALDELRRLGGDIKVSYDLTSTRLHAKAWLFHRHSGFSSAYIGSSNLTRAAQAAGLEWNVRVSEVRNRQVIEKFAAAFASHWSDADFVDYDGEQFSTAVARAAAPSSPQVIPLSPVEITLRPFQERMLEQVAVSREHGFHRNLLVAATGTGKTVMAAVDFARLYRRDPRLRLLFVAHREEILAQSLATFRHALRDSAFGELWVRGARPTHFDHVFASIQSLHADRLVTLNPARFDVVIVDEFHHAAADSYRRLLSHVRPRELLGLTATPERSDGLPILHWFGDRVAAELRVWDAINQQYLVPFVYYGLHDDVDLTGVPWRRGSGYDLAALSKVYTGHDAWARRVLQEVDRHADQERMRCLGFCVSVEHARFMASTLTRHGIPAVAISAESPQHEREAALRDLERGTIRAVFSVDLFNEGVDVPRADTVLLLRPTESPVLFLQQLGRGLRPAEGKSHCTVLDFVGTHRTEFRFDRRFRALLGGTRRELEEAVRGGFPFLPAGCSMQLDRKAEEVVLRSIRTAIPSRWRAMVTELASLRHARPTITLAEFLGETGLELEDVYANNRSWSDLLAAAGAPVSSGSHEAPLRRAIGRCLHIDDLDRIGALRHLLADGPDVSLGSERERRLLRMLLAQLGGAGLSRSLDDSQAVDVIWRHDQVRAELNDLAPLLTQRINHLQQTYANGDVPLRIHARYSRPEILAAFGLGHGVFTPQWREGVKYLPDSHCDLLAFTLDKSNGGFSPQTRYRDFALSDRLIHWQSQSTTRADSETGRRYRQHTEVTHQILLFARLRRGEAFWFLGPARYVSHEGERPMSIVWALDHPLSGDLFAQFCAVAA